MSPASYSSDDSKFEDRTRIVPILGYTGQFRGKVDGIVGRSASRSNLAISEMKIGEDNDHFSFSRSSSNSSLPDILTFPDKKQYITGYTGGSKFKPEHEPEAKSTNRILRPIVGYKGYYRGKINGALGRVEFHASPISRYDPDVRRDLLGDDNFTKRVVLGK